MRLAGEAKRSLLAALALVISSLACATLTRGFSSPATEQPEPAAVDSGTASSTGSGLIAFLGIDDNIYTIDREGNHLTAVTGDAHQFADEGGFKIYNYPTWSPDGKKLAFVGFAFSGGLQGAQLEVADVDTGDTHVVFSSVAERPFYLYWAPDSEHLSFLTSDPGASGLLMRIAFLDGQEAVIADGGEPFYWVWSPDAAQIFVHEGGSKQANPDAGLYLLSPEGEKGEEFSLSAESFQAPAWSPDGELLLAAGTDGDSRFLSLLDRQGNPVKVLSQFANRISFTWSPDGTYIATLATEASSLLGTLEVITSENPESPTVIVRDQVVAYFWSPDSSQLAYFALAAGGGVDALMSTQSQQEASLALKILDVGSGRARQVAELRPPDDLTQVFPFFDQYHHSATIWSPDSSQIVYASIEADGPGIWVVDANGASAPLRLAAGTLAFWSWK